MLTDLTIVIILFNRGDVISLVVRSLKNPRSAVCKTAIMTSADIFNAYNDLVVDSLDPLVNLNSLKFCCYIGLLCFYSKGFCSHIRFNC